MSCRIIGRTGSAHALHLFTSGERECHTGAGLTGASDAAAESAAAPAELTELHNKVVDLERALQTNVRHAREAGFQEGEKAGRENALQEVQPAMERLARSAAELASLRTRIRRESESELVLLSIAIARRILRREVSVEPEAIHGLVKAAMEKAQHRDICRIRVHPSHASAVRKNLELAGAAAEIAADTSLQTGDVIVETKRGDLDASVETQLQEIERGFADRLKETN